MDNEIKTKLEAPFDPSVIKKRRGPNGSTLSYVAVGEYIRRLNQVFGPAWSFEIVAKQLVEDQIVVEGRLTINDNVKSGIGGTTATRRREDGRFVSLADDYKSAASDSLKRCCRLLGIGVELYADDHVEVENRQSVRPQNQHSDGRNANSNGENEGRVTVAQMNKLQELVAETGMDWRSYRDSVRRQHDVNIEYADRGLASKLIGDLIEHVRKRGNGGGGNGHGGNGSGGNGRYPSDQGRQW